MFITGVAIALARVRLCLSVGGMIRAPPPWIANRARRPGSPGLPICIGRDFQEGSDGPPVSVQTIALTSFQSSVLNPWVLAKWRLNSLAIRMISQSYSSHAVLVKAPSIVSFHFSKGVLWWVGAVATVKLHFLCRTFMSYSDCPRVAVQQSLCQAIRQLLMARSEKLF